MESEEQTRLLVNGREKSVGLSTLFAVICIVDVFGVFPIVSLPKSIIDCGTLGILIVIIVCSLQIYTAVLLGKCWLLAEHIHGDIEEKNRYPYAALAEITFGHKVSKLVTVLLDITVFTGGIPNLLVAAQTLQLFSSRISDGTFTLSFCYWIMILGVILCPLLWFGSPKDMKLVCTISVIMVLLLFIIMFSVILSDTNPPPTNLESSKPLWQNLITAFGILTFQFDIHPTILTVQVDMQKKSDVDKAILGGFAVSLGMFLIVASAAFIKYGSEIHPSLLGNLPTSIWLHLSALLVALQLGLTCVVSNSALYLHMEDSLGISRDFNYKRCILRSSVTIVAVLIAESVPRLDIVMSLIGGTFIGPLVFIFPPLIYLRIKDIKRKHDENLQLETLYDEFTFRPDSGAAVIKQKRARRLLEIFLCYVIVGVGITGIITGTYLNIKNAIDYTTFSQPCIYNLTSVLSIQ